MKIFCVGRNYMDHAKELNNAVPIEPIIFCKLPTALSKGDKPFYHPEFSNNIHYEAELVYRVCKNGKHIQEKFAQKYYDQITIGIDFTARDIQHQLKEKGKPWELAKSFDQSAILGSMKPLDDKNAPIQFRLNRNGEQVQLGNTADMLFSIDQLIVYISSYFTLQQGDLIYSGTPAGVGKVEIGDQLEGFIGDESLFNIKVK